MQIKTYTVNHIKSYKVVVTGKGSDEAWEKAEILSDFVSAWDSKKPKTTEFKALWNAENLLFLFKVYDNVIHINKKDNTINSIGSSDRIELFFRSDENLNPYYCLEIDPSSRLMDFRAYPNKEFDFNWHWPQKDILIKSDIQNDFFTVEGSISLASLKTFNLIRDNKIEVGIFRVKYNKIGRAIYEPTWISWVNPNTEIPNFHVPSSFGILQSM